MNSRTGAIRDSMTARWTKAKPLLTGLVIGLIAGPIISGFSGFQVRTSTAQAASHAAVVEQQAMFCEARARAARTDDAQLGYQARYELAREWATMPGATEPQNDVIYACSDRLSR